MILNVIKLKAMKECENRIKIELRKLYALQHSLGEIGLNPVSEKLFWIANEMQSSIDYMGWVIDDRIGDDGQFKEKKEGEIENG